MKKLNLFLFIFLIFFSSFSKSYSEDKIVFLDVEFAVNNSNIGQKILNNLNETRKNEINKLKKIEEELKVKDQDINNVKNIISKDELDKKIKEFKKEIEKFNAKKNQIQKQFAKDKNNKLDELFKKINPLIIKYMDDNSIEMIIGKNNVYLAKSNLDITKDIIELINKNFK
jgi:Skp family chaperone for outer membrane proteins